MKWICLGNNGGVSLKFPHPFLQNNICLVKRDRCRLATSFVFHPEKMFDGVNEFRTKLIQAGLDEPRFASNRRHLVGRIPLSVRISYLHVGSKRTL